MLFQVEVHVLTVCLIRLCDGPSLSPELHRSQEFVEACVVYA
jgi:hypothetical protein